MISDMSCLLLKDNYIILETSRVLTSVDYTDELAKFYNLYLNSSLSLTDRTARRRFDCISLLEKQRRKETVIPWVEVERQEKTW